MKITEGQLRRIIRQEVQALREAQGADDAALELAANDDQVESFLADAQDALDDNRSQMHPAARLNDVIKAHKRISDKTGAAYVTRADVDYFAKRHPGAYSAVLRALPKQF